MRTSLVVFALMTTLIAGSPHAEQLPEVVDVQSELESARAGSRRVGVELRNSSTLYGTVAEVKKTRFTLDEQKLGRRTIRYEDIRALLDPTNGAQIATVR